MLALPKTVGILPLAVRKDDRATPTQHHFRCLPKNRSNSCSTRLFVDARDSQ